MKQCCCSPCSLCRVCRLPRPSCFSTGAVHSHPHRLGIWPQEGQAGRAPAEHRPRGPASLDAARPLTATMAGLPGPQGRAWPCLGPAWPWPPRWQRRRGFCSQTPVLCPPHCNKFNPDGGEKGSEGEGKKKHLFLIISPLQVQAWLEAVYCLADTVFLSFTTPLLLFFFFLLQNLILKLKVVLIKSVARQNT